MEFAIWAYPWDLIDEGVETVAERLGEVGISEINLATNYHTVQTFHPHNPKRKTFFSHASAYFQPTHSYGRLQPVPAPSMGERDWLQEIADGLAETPISLNSWTVGCHNSRLGMANPDVTLRTPYGDSLAFGLCPSHPDVREYLLNLLVELEERECFERIELETFHYFHGTGWGWHHEKFHVKLGTLGEFLWGLCFCDHCRAKADEAGVSVSEAKASCQEALDAIIAHDLAVDTDPDTWLAAHSAVAEYVEVRKRTLESLYETLSQTTTADLGSYVGMLGVENSWMHGLDLERQGDHLDHYTVMAYRDSVDEAVEEYTTTVDQSPNTTVDAGLLPAHPIVTDEEIVAGQVDELASAGAERISFYNYGLLPERNLQWIEQAIEPYVGE